MAHPGQATEDPWFLRHHDWLNFPAGFLVSFGVATWSNPMVDRSADNSLSAILVFAGIIVYQIHVLGRRAVEARRHAELLRAIMSSKFDD